ncbi:MAG: N-acetylmuramoyl-L-alanine amidase [Litorimonas sp.]
MSSPNFNARKLPISILVLHYTGMESGALARDRLCDPSAEVSAHWLVHEDGAIESLVAEEHRAWHAGVGSWNGIIDVNSASIGIEIVNGGHNVPQIDGSLPPYPDAQILAVIKLAKDIVGRHNIKPQNVVGHSDIAPDRKEDPGEHFPWAGLAAAGIGLWPGELPEDNRIVFEAGDRDRGLSIIQRGLADLGYGASVTGCLDEQTQAIIRAIQRRYRPARIDGVIDMSVMEILKRLSEMMRSPALFLQ